MNFVLCKIAFDDVSLRSKPFMLSIPVYVLVRDCVRSFVRECVSMVIGCVHCCRGDADLDD